MRKFFVGLVMLVAFLSLFAEGNPKEPHTCLEYAKARRPNFESFEHGMNFWDYLDSTYQIGFDTLFIPNWFEHLEFADNNENSGYSRDFLKEHSGRSGKIVYTVQDIRYPLLNGKYFIGCSGVLIGENYFLTAGHCAVSNVEVDLPTDDGTATVTLDADVKNVGVLFGYQKADLEDNDDDEYDDDEINDDDSTALEYPRVSLKGYLNNDNDYILYGDPESEYPDFDWHPAYFPIVDDDVETYNDGSVEHGWEINGDGTDKIDYAIYKLGKNSNYRLPANDYDPWKWESENNQSLRNTLDTDLVTPWILPNNTNGFRGWERVNTSILQENSEINIVGSPGVASFNEYKGLKVVNAGRVVNGKGRNFAYKDDHEEDILIFKNADIQIGHSGSPIIDHLGKVAGIVSWLGCAPGGKNAWDAIFETIENDFWSLMRPIVVQENWTEVEE